MTVIRLPRRTATFAEMVDADVPDLVRSARQGDPDAMSALHSALAFMLRDGELGANGREILATMHEQIAAGTAAADATITKLPPNAPNRGTRDQYIYARVRGERLAWLRARRDVDSNAAALRAFERKFGRKPPTVDAIARRVGVEYKLRAATVKRIYYAERKSRAR